MPFNENQPLPSTGAAPVVANSGSSWWGLLGMLLVFLVILFVSLWILRRLNQSNMRSMNIPWARILDRQILYSQQNLYLVEIAGQLQVLGGSDHHLIKICDIDDPEIAAEILEELATRPTERVEGLAKGFNKLFKKPTPRRDSFSKELAQLLEEVDK
jgi:flagellar protein FliO/FliZ